MNIRPQKSVPISICGLIGNMLSRVPHVPAGNGVFRRHCHFKVVKHRTVQSLAQFLQNVNLTF